MNHTTLGLAAVFIAAALVIGTFAVATTPAFAGGRGKNSLKVGDPGRNSLKVGDTRNICIEAADNAQHAAFGSGSTADLATNAPINTQSQTCNVGSTGAG
jgi:hypothetical protein